MSSNDEISAAERYYDEHIAPKLREIATECKARGLSFLAVCEWNPGEIGRTALLQAESGIGIRLANTAAQANGNVDSFLMAVIGYAKEHGHGSVYLRLLGVPEAPNETASGKEQG